MRSDNPFRTGTLPGLAALAALAHSAPALACGGLAPLQTVVAPEDGEAAVAVGVRPLVIGRGASLEQADGTPVPVSLEPVGTAQPGGIVDGGQVHFQSRELQRVVPEVPLLPDTEYRLRVLGGDPPVGYPPLAADAGAPASVTFTTASAGAAAPPDPVVPEGFGMTFYFVPGANGASCEGPGQIELRGWDDGTWLEVCFDYYVDFEGLDEPAEPRSRCTLTRHPFRFIIDEGDPSPGAENPRWIERAEVRALALDGRLSATRVFARDELEQLRVDRADGSRTPIVVTEVDGVPRLSSPPATDTPNGASAPDDAPMADAFDVALDADVGARDTGLGGGRVVSGGCSMGAAGRDRPGWPWPASGLLIASLFCRGRRSRR